MTKLSPNGGASAASSPSTPRKGWRGLSVDLITNPVENIVPPDPDESQENWKLDGQIVKVIWSKSKLRPEKLREIW